MKVLLVFSLRLQAQWNLLKVITSVWMKLIAITNFFSFPLFLRQISN